MACAHMIRQPIDDQTTIVASKSACSIQHSAGCTAPPPSLPARTSQLTRVCTTLAARKHFTAPLPKNVNLGTASITHIRERLGDRGVHHPGPAVRLRAAWPVRNVVIAASYDTARHDEKPKSKKVARLRRQPTNEKSSLSLGPVARCANMKKKILSKKGEAQGNGKPEGRQGNERAIDTSLPLPAGLDLGVHLPRDQTLPGASASIIYCCDRRFLLTVCCSRSSAGPCGTSRSRKASPDKSVKGKDRRKKKSSQTTEQTTNKCPCVRIPAANCPSARTEL